MKKIQFLWSDSFFIRWFEYFCCTGIKMILKFWQWQIWLQHINEMRYWSLKKSWRCGFVPITVLSGLLISSLLLWVVSKICYFFLPCFPQLSFSLYFLQSNRKTIMDDPFIRNYIEDLLKNIRTQVLLKLIKPYTRIRIPFISKVNPSFYLMQL